jgi:SsrA-binding protein
MTIAKNRKARHNYQIIDTLEAGISLQGSEVKSCRAGMVDLTDAYVDFTGGEAILMHAYIAPYDKANQLNHDQRRARRLLLKGREIHRWGVKVLQQGLTVVPLSFYFKGPLVKVELALVRGRSTIDKRQVLREKDDKREIERKLKSARRR